MKINVHAGDKSFLWSIGNNFTWVVWRTRDDGRASATALATGEIDEGLFEGRRTELCSGWGVHRLDLRLEGRRQVFKRGSGKSFAFAFWRSPDRR
jgi:hypothetical protein